MRRARADYPTNRILRFQRFVEVVDGALPGEFGGGFVVTRRRVIVETVVGFRIHAPRI